MSTVPTMLTLWPPSALERVRLLILGGEACPTALAERLARGSSEVWNRQVGVGELSVESPHVE